jgi:hypothetical protein
MTRITTTMFALALGLLGACETEATGELDPQDQPGTQETTSGEGETYSHDNSGYSPWEYIERLKIEGPPKYTSRVHSCSKVRYETLGNVLRSLGVDMGAQGELSAAQLYARGGNAMGAANFANRIRENVGVTTSGSSRLFDIFAAAADEIIAAVPNLERCKIGGVGAQLFDGTTCRADGLTCILGLPAKPAHIEFCNAAVRDASAGNGPRIAVASILAAAYTCE